MTKLAFIDPKRPTFCFLFEGGQVKRGFKSATLIGHAEDDGYIVAKWPVDALGLPLHDRDIPAFVAGNQGAKISGEDPKLVAKHERRAELLNAPEAARFDYGLVSQVADMDIDADIKRGFLRGLPTDEQIAATNNEREQINVNPAMTKQDREREIAVLGIAMRANTGDADAKAKMGQINGVFAKAAVTDDPIKQARLLELELMGLRSRASRGDRDARAKLTRVEYAQEVARANGKPLGAVLQQMNISF